MSPLYDKNDVGKKRIYYLVAQKVKQKQRNAYQDKD